ncbi:hypothetical protein Lpp120_1828 [Lacticaseibacillus paracasei subsp. paracasei Lpp120]|uniref:Uncharacterized protein n=1 Tax=Lacticaseibacillus paracasei subsp. paracasei Lpp22 TaxID=1256221 RepID=A0A8E0ICB4_LACPA|nr:hypothetical protein LCAUW4_2025 [Lacticaseibacillus casei UW4]EPC31555.1 hypothetical protein Lpp120_1828 [Lacticaseibacillus paracasei subsp. paracasei Lpp120]EPC32754.1 hypothetical protein Lpp22_0385 [Lacticaseibacillus paracasei subsp. paracasei Lpp22]
MAVWVCQITVTKLSKNLLVDAKIAVFSELQGDIEPADYFKHHAFA